MTYAELIQDALSKKPGANSPMSNLGRHWRARQQAAQREAKRSTRHGMADRPRGALIRRGEIEGWLALAKARRDQNE